MHWKAVLGCITIPFFLHAPPKYWITIDNSVSVPKTQSVYSVALQVADSLVELGAKCSRDTIALGLLQTGWCESNLNASQSGGQGSFGAFQWRERYYKKLFVPTTTLQEQLWQHIQWMKAANTITRIRCAADIHLANLSPLNMGKDYVSASSIKGIDKDNDGITTKTEFMRWRSKRLRDFKIENYF